MLIWKTESLGMNKWLLSLPTYLIIDAFGSDLKAVFIFSWNRKPIANIREEKNEQSKRVGSLIGKVLPCGFNLSGEYFLQERNAFRSQL